MAPFAPLKVLVITPARNASTVMAYDLIFNVLSAAGLIAASIVLEHRIEPMMLNGADLVILCRCSNERSLSLMRLARKKKVPILYELDDDLLFPPEDELWGQKIIRLRHTEILRLFLNEADRIKAGSELLASRLKNLGYPAFYLPYPVELLESPLPKKDSLIRIGYYGTPHHRNDIAFILPALIEVQNQCPEEIIYEFYGCFPNDVSKLRNVSCLPFTHNYHDFLKNLSKRNWTLGLAPMKPTAFNEAKSDSKFREYAAVGVPTVFCNIAPYRSLVIHNHNGWLAEPTLEDWSQKIMFALNHPDKESIVRNARIKVQIDNAPQRIGMLWMDMVMNLINSR